MRDCDKYGLAFVGPSAKVIDSMGDKDAARRTAAAAGVPIVPGCDLLKSPEEATAEAERIGCPVLIKARAGGGGRGIRKVERVEDAAKAFIEARAEGEAVFGDGECYMEKFVAPAHHVEVQIMADKQGHVFSLGERECSVQRRNQKLIEESPAPCLDGRDDIRARMHKAARDLARAVGYEGAGTIEFLYSDDGNFYFMEMNTRLQVEHPVTEFVTDTDLVKWQPASLCPLSKRTCRSTTTPWSAASMPKRQTFCRHAERSPRCVCRAVRACAGIPPCLPVREFRRTTTPCSASSSCVRPRVTVPFARCARPWASS